MEHFLKDIALRFMLKHIAHMTVCYNFSLVRDKPLGAPAFVKLVYWKLSTFQGNGQIQALFNVCMNPESMETKRPSGHLAQ